ncbi:hypothetical protein NGF19_00345 [Streptomyces sp. RY43-2]|uniref:Lipoprotein n=1 Tax=Streptomyces macrolidinus TaxID=2952607 RepID=A0ABT0Z675_9ACTN|nr:hypothetical protein [Streptomyces macrolidinus]MCN9239253.1 hypothetical protein [Streptomyces macrolidinus]
MRRRTLHLAAVAAAALLLAGCGTQRDGTASPAPPPSPRGCPAEVRLTAADDGRALCLTTGGRLRLTLHGSEDRPWTPVTATGGALRPVNAGVAVRKGDAVAAFEAVAPGTARLTSTRPLCARRPGQNSCPGVQRWTVTVRVTAR